MSDPSTGQTELARHLASLVALVEPIREATMGYRNSLIQMGLDKPAADRCAADFHHWMIHNLTKGKS